MPEQAYSGGRDTFERAVSGGGGAIMSTHHRNRNQDAYLIMESELKTLSLFNMGATGLFSAGAFFLSIAMRDGLENIDYQSLDFMASVVLGAAGILHLVCRQSLVRHIRDTSS